MSNEQLHEHQIRYCIICEDDRGPTDTFLEETHTRWIQDKSRVVQIMQSLRESDQITNVAVKSREYTAATEPEGIPE